MAIKMMIRVEATSPQSQEKESSEVQEQVKEFTNKFFDLVLKTYLHSKTGTYFCSKAGYDANDEVFVAEFRPIKLPEPSKKS